MNSDISDYLELSRLLGIKIVYENDLYELAKLTLNIMDATGRMSGNYISKPTINGLASNYSMIIGQAISPNQVIEAAKQNGLYGNYGIDFDRGDKKRFVPKKIGSIICWNYFVGLADFKGI